MGGNYRRLYRSQNERMLAGVCGGIAEYFDIDPTIIRLIWVVAGLCAGCGLIAYIICAIVIPNAPYDSYGPYGPNGPYNQNGPNGPYNQNDQNGPYNQNGPNGPNGPNY